METPEVIKRKLLAAEARLWVGTKEVGGNNCGQIIEMFQREVDGIAMREPYCMAFVQYCVRVVDDLFAGAFPDIAVKPRGLPKTEGCVPCWMQVTVGSRQDMPSIGSIAVWQRIGDEVHGHTGIVVEINPDGFKTVEANVTSQDHREVSPGGVEYCNRVVGDTTTLRLLGFIDPWA